MRAIHIDVRKAIVRFYETTKDIKQTCASFGVSRSSVFAFVKRSTLGLPLQANPKTQPSRFTQEQRQAIVNWATESDPKVTPTTKRIANRFKKVFNLTISLRTIGRILKNSNLTYKRVYVKLKQKPRKRKDKKVAAPTKVKFSDQVKNGVVKRHRILSLDETGWKHGVVSSLRCWSRRNQRYEKYMYRGNYNRPSMLCLIDSQRGIVDYDVLFGKAWNKEYMVQFLRKALIGFSGYHLIMDNVAFHHSACVQNVLEEMGVKPLFIDPYTPSQNPIEEMFSPIKAFVAARSPNTRQRFEKVLSSVMKRIRPKQIASYFARSLAGIM